MICEKCGSNNAKNSSVCAKCGAKMPATEICGGFADILTYNGSVSQSSNNNGVDEKVIRNLERKVNAAVQANRKLTVISLISLIISVVVLVCFIFTTCNSGGCTSGSEDVKQTEKSEKSTGDSENQTEESQKQTEESGTQTEESGKQTEESGKQTEEFGNPQPPSASDSGKPTEESGKFIGGNAEDFPGMYE
ncbi:MAG: hypothetical protein IKV86_04085 [Clostridia bacterium]|nr:hypothetical protein [Clostridia bacterium]